MKTIIYKAKSPSGKEYIGITSKSLKSRICDHRYASKKFNHPFGKAVKKYGDNLEWEILFIVDSWEEACKEEIRLIKEYNTFVPNGYNATRGGEGSVGRIITEEERLRLSTYKFNNSGIKFSKEHCKRISESRKGQVSSNKGKITSLETRTKQSISNLGQKRSTNTRLKMKKYQPFEVFKNGLLVFTFDYIVDCCEKLKTKSSRVSDCLKGKRNKHLNYTFKFVDQEKNEYNGSNIIKQLSDSLK